MEIYEYIVYHFASTGGLEIINKLSDIYIFPVVTKLYAFTMSTYILYTLYVIN